MAVDTHTPHSWLVPRSRGGVGSVTPNPRTEAQTARLRTYLYVKTKTAYRNAITAEAKRYGIDLTGPVTDPVALFNLAQRAAFASQSVATTLQAQTDRIRAGGGSVADLLESRGAWKPEQIWRTEMATAQNAAFNDFYGNNPTLKAQQTAHIEPLDAVCPICIDAVDMGSVPIDDLPDMPAHIGCEHAPSSDGPDESDDVTLLGSGSILYDDAVTGDGGTMSSGSVLLESVSAASVTASLLAAARFWVAGMVIAAALGDKKEDQQDSTKAARIRTRLTTVAFDLDNAALHPEYCRYLVPMAQELAQGGTKIGVLTGNDSAAAKTLWTQLGYPEPAFWAVHEKMDTESSRRWKAEQCKRRRVRILYDDFKHGKKADVFVEHAKEIGWLVVPLQVLLPDDVPMQKVGM